MEASEMEIVTMTNDMIILATARRIAKKNNMDWAKIENEAMSKDHEQFLRTMNKYFVIC